MKLTSITTRSQSSGSCEWRRARGCRAFEYDHVAAVAQPRVELPVPDIDGIDAARAAASSTSVNPPVEAPTSRPATPAGVNAEMIECRRELHAAARHIGMRGAAASIAASMAISSEGFATGTAVGGDQPGRDCGLRLGAALEQAALDQQPIGAHASGHVLWRQPWSQTLAQVRRIRRAQPTDGRSFPGTELRCRSMKTANTVIGR